MDPARHSPEWVAYTLRYKAPQTPGRDCSWGQDASVDASFQARDSDYRNSGFERGHLAPAKTFSYSCDAECSTFTFINAAPQIKSVNAGAWKWGEMYVRKYLLDNPASTVHVITGVLHKRKTVKELKKHTGVHVPTNFYTAVYDATKKRGFGMIAGNDNTAKGNKELPALSLAELEAQVGISLFKRAGFLSVGISEAARTAPWMGGGVDAATKAEPYMHPVNEQCRPFCKRYERRGRGGGM
jgi:endonuclease G